MGGGGGKPGRAETAALNEAQAERDQLIAQQNAELDKQRQNHIDLLRSSISGGSQFGEPDQPDPNQPIGGQS